MSTLCWPMGETPWCGPRRAAVAFAAAKKTAATAEQGWGRAYIAPVAAFGDDNHER